MAPLAAGRRVAAAVDRIELLPRAWHLFELGSRRAAGADGRDRGDRRERGRHVLVGKGLARVARAARARGLALTVHLEPYGKRTAASTADDIRYLRGLGVRTFYVYDAERIAADEWSAALTPFGSARLYAGARCASAVRADGVAWVRRASRGRNAARPSSPERACVRRAVVRGTTRRTRLRDDRELQRVARGHPDRAGELDPARQTRDVSDVRRRVPPDRQSCRALVYRP